MRVRYKKSGAEAWSSTFNPHGFGEVLTGDDSAFISELDVFVPDIGWMDMRLAFQERDIIPDNYNLHFGVPPTPADKARGYMS